MTAPDELVQAVHDTLQQRWWGLSEVAVLDAVPDGFVKLDGTWRRLTDDEVAVLK